MISKSEKDCSRTESTACAMYCAQRNAGTTTLTSVGAAVCLPLSLTGISPPRQSAFRPPFVIGFSTRATHPRRRYSLESPAPHSQWVKRKIVTKPISAAGRGSLLAEGQNNKNQSTAARAEPNHRSCQGNSPQRQFNL